MKKFFILGLILIILFSGCIKNSDNLESLKDSYLDILGTSINCKYSFTVIGSYITNCDYSGVKSLESCLGLNNKHQGTLEWIENGLHKNKKIYFNEEDVYDCSISYIKSQKDINLCSKLLNYNEFSLRCYKDHYSEFNESVCSYINDFNVLKDCYNSYSFKAIDYNFSDIPKCDYENAFVFYRLYDNNKQILEDIFGKDVYYSIKAYEEKNKIYCNNVTPKHSCYNLLASQGIITLDDCKTLDTEYVGCNINLARYFADPKICDTVFGGSYETCLKSVSNAIVEQGNIFRCKDINGIFGNIDLRYHCIKNSFSVMINSKGFNINVDYNLNLCKFFEKYNIMPEKVNCYLSLAKNEKNIEYCDKVEQFKNECIQTIEYLT
jgi:hypothetical protein